MYFTFLYIRINLDSCNSAENLCESGFSDSHRNSPRLYALFDKFCLLGLKLISFLMYTHTQTPHPYNPCHDGALNNYQLQFHICDRIIIHSFIYLFIHSFIHIYLVNLTNIYNNHDIQSHKSSQGLIQQNTKKHEYRQRHQNAEMPG